MDRKIRDAVARRAEFRCEYCRLPQEAAPFVPFHVEHILARQHRQDDSDENLALSCDRCNAYKGPNLSSIDPVTETVVALYHPRRDIWMDHFSIESGVIKGETPTGRATARLLNMNAPRRVHLRLEFE